MEEIIIIQLTGLILIMVSIPLIGEKIKPNRWYGFRTPTTLSDEEIWYKANKQTSIDMAILGVCMVFGSLFIEKYEAWFMYFPFFLIGGVMIMLVKGFLLIDKMKKDKKD